MDTKIGVTRLQEDDVLMGETRRKYSREFKLEAVRMVVEQGRSVRDVAKGLGVNPGVIQRWRTDPKLCYELGLPGSSKPSVTDEEVRRLRRELATAQQEREILRKALGFFSKAKS